MCFSGLKTLIQGLAQARIACSITVEQSDNKLSHAKYLSRSERREEGREGDYQVEQHSRLKS